MMPFAARLTQPKAGSHAFLRSYSRSRPLAPVLPASLGEGGVNTRALPASPRRHRATKTSLPAALGGYVATLRGLLARILDARSVVDALLPRLRRRPMPHRP